MFRRLLKRLPPRVLRLFAATSIAGAIVLVLASTVPRTPTLHPTREVVFDNERVEVTLTGRIARLNPLFVSDGVIYAMEDHYLYVSDDGGISFEQRGKLPKDSLLDKPKDVLARNRITRLLRKSRLVENLVMLPSGTLVIVYDGIYRSSDGGWTFEAVYKLPSHIEEPFGQGMAVTPAGEIYFGEYDAVGRPNEITVWKGSDDGRAWEVVHQFELGDIFHVHSITYDPYREGLLVATGDRNEENHLYFTNDDFETLTEIGGGSQDWRIVSLLPAENGLYWGSDNDREGADILKWDFERQRLEHREFIGTVSYYSTRLSDGTLVVSTAHEPQSMYAHAHLPQGVSLWVSRDGSEWDEIFSLESSAEPGTDDTARAQFLLPGGDGSSDFLVFASHHTAQHDFVYHRLELRWKSQPATEASAAGPMLSGGPKDRQARQPCAGPAWCRRLAWYRRPVAR